MSARHGESIHVVAERPADSAAEQFVVYGNKGRLSREFVRFDPQSWNVELPARSISQGDVNDTPVAFYRRRFGFAPPQERQPLQLLSDLGAAMRFNDFADEESDIPAAYTYLGQFVFHDLSRMVPGELATKPLNERSAVLDLDSVFELPAPLGGACPEHSVEMPLGCTYSGRLLDLPRTRKGRPVIADGRNDDNLPLAQIHMALIRFFNAVSRVTADEDEARVMTQLHFQSVILHDYLPRVIDREVYCDVIKHGRAVVHSPEPKPPERNFLLPLEFAAACARFGHSMIRNRYPWNISHPRTSLAGFWENTYNSGYPPFVRLPDSWATRWQRLLGVRLAAGEPAIKAARIRTCLSQPLNNIPIRALPDDLPSDAITSSNLATRSLERGYALELNSGQEIARQINGILKACGRPEFQVLTPDEAMTDEPPEVRRIMCDTGGGKYQCLARETPLWFYNLKEAEARAKGMRLGPLGSRVVMETLHAAIEMAPVSILRLQSGGSWWPDTRLRPSAPCIYTFPDLVAFAGLIEA